MRSAGAVIMVMVLFYCCHLKGAKVCFGGDNAVIVECAHTITLIVRYENN
jgi:hypothetical protein